MNERRDFPNHSDIHQPLNFSEVGKSGVNKEQTKQTSFSFAPENIKVLVEIANSSFDISLNKKIKMSANIVDILDITWTTSPVNYQVNIHANTLWISGKLTAGLMYTKTNNPKIHLQHITIPWKKNCSLEFTYPPIPPLGDEKKHFEFTNQTSNQHSTEHYEQIIYHNEHPILEVVSTRVITSKDITEENTHFYLNLHINSEIFYRLFQYQVLRKKE
ncbi:MAG: hypothetical protein Q8934_13340 [Bacillota bacterium]|nr:hypothetical protein [Bacillota bacterium]